MEATLNDALTRLLTDRNARVRSGDCVEDTVTFYKRQSGHLVRVLGHAFRLVRFESATVVSNYIHTRRQQGAADTTIEKEIDTLRAALGLAKEAGLWKGALDAVIPASFNPKYKPKERDLTREEFLALIPHLSPDAAAAAAFIVATSAEDAALRPATRDDLPGEIDAEAPRTALKQKNPAKRGVVQCPETESNCRHEDFQAVLRELKVLGMISG